jgi:hypothetical protein
MQNPQLKRKRGRHLFKKTIVILLTILMMLTLASCGVRKSLDDKIAEKVTEGVVNKATGGEANIDIDKGEMTLKGKDGEKITFGEGKWPKGEAASHIPEFKKGKIITAANSDKACTILIEQVEEKDYKQYVEELKGRGFTNDAAEFTSESSQNYKAYLNENTMVFLLYDTEQQALTISLEISE